MSMVAPKLWKLVAGLAISGSVSALFAGTAYANSASLPSFENSNFIKTVSAIQDKPSVISITAGDKISGSASFTLLVSNGKSFTPNTPPIQLESSSLAAPSQPKLGSVVTLPLSQAIVSENMPSLPNPSIPKVSSDIAPITLNAPSVITPKKALSVPVVTQQAIRTFEATFVSTPMTMASYLSGETMVAKTATGQPIPPQSNGLLTRLAGELAGSVVPRIQTGINGFRLLPVSRTELLIVTIITVLSSLLIQSYGITLRRSGHQTAARSDISLTTFATPISSDYGGSQLPIVFFSGVRDQNPYRIRFLNAYTKGGE